MDTKKAPNIKINKKVKRNYPCCYRLYRMGCICDQDHECPSSNLEDTMYRDWKRVNPEENRVKL